MLFLMMTRVMIANIAKIAKIAKKPRDPDSFRLEM